ncbi:MAG: hypothetical protein GTN65_11020 [Armatimonadetes bacterium]|nr:hypothetical protein [Armatimonadota bacterium]NIO97599.1 hypothetical protein [Armatimonadota bacterium]
MGRARLAVAAVFLLCCLAVQDVSAQDKVESPARQAGSYISKEVLVLLENDLATLADLLSQRYRVTYTTEDVAYPYLKEIAEAHRLSARMDLLIIQQNNEIIRLLERLVEMGEPGGP